MPPYGKNLGATLQKGTARGSAHKEIVPLHFTSVLPSTLNKKRTLLEWEAGVGKAAWIILWYSKRAEP